MMTIADAMVKAGIVTLEETPNAKRKQRQERESISYRQEIEARKADHERPSCHLSEVYDHRVVARIVSPEARQDVPKRGEKDREEDGSPPRVTGEMVWLHKTAPILVIHGRKGLSPEEMAAGRRR